MGWWKTNTVWIFSGIGVSVPLAVVGWLMATPAPEPTISADNGGVAVGGNQVSITGGGNAVTLPTPPAATDTPPAATVRADHNGQAVGGDNIGIHGDGNTVNHNTTSNYYQSADYQALSTNLANIQQLAKDHPENPSYSQQLAELQQKMADFKRDVLQLAEEFSKLKINTERLRLAKQHFDAGDYAAARAILDAEKMGQDQQSLLNEKARLQERQAENAAHLEDNATEFILKAQLTALDYSLPEPERIAQTSGYFNQALKSARTPENVFAFARFMQDHNQYAPAEALYREALGSYRQLAATNPAVSLPDVAMTLNNLAALVSADTSRRKEAEGLYQEALGMRRQLAAANPAVYLPYVATTLNNLAALVSADTRRRKEAEGLYQEALGNYRQLAAANPAVYLPDVAMTLNNLAVLVKADTRRRKEAEGLYQEALDSYRQLAAANPAVYLTYVAGMLNNLANLVSDDTRRRKEAEGLYQEALGHYRQLAAANPAVYLPDVAATLNNLANLVSGDTSRRKEAEGLYQEALGHYRQLAAANPAVYLPDVAGMLNNLANLVSDDTRRRKEAEGLYQEALGSYRQLVATDPGVYAPKLANNLTNLGAAYLDWHEPQKALVYLQEAATLLKPFAEQYPTVFGDRQTEIAQLIAHAS
ncbi:tetratricopeptide repeat protein [Methylovulum psychrotolerans]|uniref:tetratricopeptide repeat protein n=1 Tax=Methylovulum psychrotolerans TaxID=1704499 RepID=UPI001BFF0DBC|nr:tetratricopeptide repeat protein [Methylovulum psychrotolerans]MBT9100086.1 tetratricopeptide repeat protein [Methylovulum psychrotolerans]